MRASFSIALPTVEQEQENTQGTNAQSQKSSCKHINLPLQILQSFNLFFHLMSFPTSAVKWKVIRSKLEPFKHVFKTELASSLIRSSVLSCLCFAWKKAPESACSAVAACISPPALPPPQIFRFPAFLMLHRHSNKFTGVTRGSKTYLPHIFHRLLKGLLSTSFEPPTPPHEKNIIEKLGTSECSTRSQICFNFSHVAVSPCPSSLFAEEARCARSPGFRSSGAGFAPAKGHLTRLCERVLTISHLYGWPASVFLELLAQGSFNYQPNKNALWGKSRKITIHLIPNKNG